MAKKAISLTHSSQEEEPISLSHEDRHPVSRHKGRPKDKPGKPKVAQGSNVFVPDQAEPIQKVKHQSKTDQVVVKTSRKPGKKGKRPRNKRGTMGRFPARRHQSNPSALSYYNKALKQAETWEALVYGALERDAKGHIIFTGQTVVMGEDGRWIKKGGVPKRKEALVYWAEKAWAKLPQATLVRVLSDYGVFKDRFYKLSPYYANQVDKFPDEDWQAHALKHWVLLSTLHDAGLKLYHIFWVLAFMLDNGASMREALIYWRQARITKAYRRLYITPMPVRKVRHAWAKSIAWFESGNEPVGASEGKRYEQWVIQPRLKERV